MRRYPLEDGDEELSVMAQMRRRRCLRVSTDGLSLFTTGKYIGLIEAVLSCAQIWPWPDGTSDFLETQAASLYDFYHTVLKPLNVTPESLYSLLRGNLRNGYHLLYRDQDEFTTRLSGDAHHFLLPMPASETSQDWYRSLIRQEKNMGEWGDSDYLHHNRSLLVTKGGGISFTWHADLIGIRAGDVLVHLFWYPKPFVLRPVEGTSAYRMLSIIKG